MLNLNQPVFKVLVISILVGSISLGASAQNHRWKEHHPARAEINHRLANQHYRIHEQWREGKMSRQEARQLHRQDRQIRREERLMARQHNGHLTRPEVRLLNQQENQISREIRH